MKVISIALANHLASEVTSVCTCWKVTLRPVPPQIVGTIYGFTDHDRDVIINEGSPIGLITYEAHGGYTATAVETSSALNVDNLEVEGMLNSESITESDLNAGLWDYASIEIFQVNWRDLTQGKLYQRVGTLGEVSLSRNQFRAELRGLMQAYTRVIGRLYSPSCDAIFGDSRCGFPIATVTFPATILSVSADNAVITVDELIGSPSSIHPAGYYDYGLVRWTSGLNVGFSMEIKTHVLVGSPIGIAQITLQLPMPYQINSGSPPDTVELVAGCGKRDQDCLAFNNKVNFRGFDDLPGEDAVIRIAGQ